MGEEEGDDWDKQATEEYRNRDTLPTFVYETNGPGDPKYSF